MIFLIVVHNFLYMFGPLLNSVRTLCFMNNQVRSYFSSLKNFRPGCLISAFRPNTASFHTCVPSRLPLVGSFPLGHPSFLATSCQQQAGMKSKTSVKRRCKDCFVCIRKGRVYVYCKTHPRHKQRQA